MPEIISLCDSDNEVPASSTTSSRPKKVSIESASNTVNLMEDSDDEMDLGKAIAWSRAEADGSTNPAATTITNTISQEAYAEPATSHKDSAKHSVINNNNNNNNKVAAMLAASSHYDSDDSSILQVEAPPSSKPKANTKSKAKPKAGFLLSHDSDSDDSILQFESGLGRKKQGSAPSHQADARASLDGSSNISQGPISISSKPAVGTTPIVNNPYAKTPPASGAAVRNPYLQKRSTSCSTCASSQASPTSLTLTPVHNPYAKQTSSTTTRESTTSVAGRARASNVIATTEEPPPISYPTLLSNSKLYPDLRAKYILSFWTYARTLTQHSYTRPLLDQMAKKIVALAVSDFPVMSLEEYYFRGGNAASSQNARDARDTIQTQLESGGLSHYLTPVDACRTGKYYSIAESCLVSLLATIEGRLGVGQASQMATMDTHTSTVVLGDKDMWVSLADLIPEIDGRLQDICPARLTRAKDADHGAAHYTNSSTRSAEYRQIEKLMLPGKDQEQAYIKKHHQKGQVLLELTSLGYHTARRIRTRTFPLPPSHYRCSNLTNVEAKFKDMCLGVDLREGGGGHKVLHIMCNKLDLTKIPYIVGTLSVGDYLFFARDRLCPILVERKSIQDIAMSIHDGRWKKQKQRMYHGQFVFGYDNSRIAFIIEGKQETQLVTGGYIGHRKFNVDQQRLDEEIENLKSEGFQVLRTTSPENSMFELSRWAQQVGKDVRAGKLTVQYTYEEFKKEVKKIPPTTDFSRLAKDYMATRLEQEAQSRGATKRPCSAKESDEESDIEVLGPSALSYGEEPSSGSRKNKKLCQDVAKDSVKSAPESANSSAVDYSKWSVSQLQDKCVEYGLTKSGARGKLVERLNGPRMPKVWLTRKRKGEYVPARHDCGAAALLVGLYILEKDATDAGPDHKGVPKNELYVKAEELEITKNPFSGGTTQTGPYLYDGWSNMARLLKGDPSLVALKKGRYKLTRSCEVAGYPLAEAMHELCHQYGKCKCRDL